MKHITAWNVWGRYFVCFTCGARWAYEGEGMPQTIGDIDPQFRCPNERISIQLKLDL